MSNCKGRPSRRSFLTTVMGGAALTGATSVIAGAHARQGSWSAAHEACRSGVTDSDGGEAADPVGNGRGTNITDSDSGPDADPAGEGRGRERVTDTDTGLGSDPVGHGRGGEHVRAASSRPCPDDLPSGSGGDR